MFQREPGECRKGIDVAKGKRGGRSRGSHSAGKLPGRRAKKQQGGPQGRNDPPTAAPGSAQAPAGSSIFGGSVSLPTRTVGRPRMREERRGGPRLGGEDRSRRQLPPLDFSYVRRDLTLIGITGALSLVVVLILWGTLRF